MKYTVDYFIEKFTGIPDNMWTTQSKGIDNNYRQKCALGHCGVKMFYVGDENKDCTEGRYLSKIFDKAFGGSVDYFNWFSWNVVYINDGVDKRYPQPTPKQRILAALYDVKKMQQVVDEPKTIAIVPDTALPPFQSITFEKVIEQELASVN